MYTLKQMNGLLSFKVKVQLTEAIIYLYFSCHDTVIRIELASKLQPAQNYCLRYILYLKPNRHV